MSRYLLFLLLGATVVNAADVHIYCSSTNTSAGDGTFANPYRTLSQVKATNITAQVAAGNRVFVDLQRGSIFRETWTLPAGNFSVQAYDTISTNNPVIACDDNLGGWVTNTVFPLRGASWMVPKAGVSMLFANNETLVKFTGTNLSELLNHQWYTSNNIVWLRWDEGNPDTLGVVIDASVRAVALWAEGITNVNVSDVTFRRGLVGGSVRLRNGSFFTFDRCRFLQGLQLMEVDGFSNLVVNASIFQDCPSTSSQMVRIWNGSFNWTFRYCLFENAGGMGINGSGFGNSIINCTFAKMTSYFVGMGSGYLGITNCIFSGTQAGNSSGSTAGIRSLGTCFLDRCLVMPSSHYLGTRISGATEIDPIYGEPQYVATRNPAYFIFERDDSPSISYATNDVRLLRNRGLQWPVTYNYTTTMPTPVISPADTSALRWLVTNGCEVASHARWHCSIMESRVFNLKYVGPAATAVLTIQNTNLTTTLDGVPDKQFDLKSPAYDSIGEVVAALNVGDYRCTNQLNWGMANEIESWLLANVSNANIAGVLHTNYLNWTNYLYQQLDRSKMDLEQVINPVAPGYSVKTFVLPGSLSDNTWPAINTGIVNTNLQRAGYTSCRAGASIPICSYLLSASNPFMLGNMGNVSGEVFEIPFDTETAGDASGKGNGFTGVNVTYGVPAALGAKAAIFNGTSAYLQRPASSSFDCSMGDWSFMAYLYPSNLVGRQTVYFNGTNDSNYLWIYLDAAGAAHVEAATNGVLALNLATPAGVFTNGGWRWLWVQQAFDEWNILVDDVVKATTSSAFRLPYLTSASTVYIGCRYSFASQTRADYYHGRMDELEMFVSPLFLTFAAADAMGEEAACGVFFTHASGHGKFMVKVDALQRFTGDVRVVTQAEFTEILMTNGTVSELDGMTLIRTNPLPNKPDYRLRATSPCRSTGTSAALAGLTNQVDLLGTPITDGSGEMVRSTVSIGCYQFVEASTNVPASWYEQYGLVPGPASDLMDPDGDEFNNWQEYVADTNPTNAASGLRILGIAQNGNDMDVTLLSSANRLYTLFCSPDLSPGSWASVPGRIALQGNGGVLSLTCGIDTECRFFRVCVSLP